MTLEPENTTQKVLEFASDGAAVDVLARRAGRQIKSRTSESLHPNGNAGQLLADRFRCLPGDVADFEVTENLPYDSGYFRLGPEIVCYGRCSSGIPAKHATDSLHDAREYVVTGDSLVRLPFDPAQVVDSLRCERYIRRPLPSNQIVRGAYYLLRPLMPVAVRKHFQRLYFSGW